MVEKIKHPFSPQDHRPRKEPGAEPGRMENPYFIIHVIQKSARKNREKFGRSAGAGTGRDGENAADDGECPVPGGGGDAGGGAGLHPG